MSEERAKILKMLKEGRITVEEAELLLDALGEGASETGSSERAAATDRHEERESRGDRQRTRTHEWRHQFGPRGGWFDFDFTGFGPGFQDAFKGWRSSFEEFLKNVGNVSWESELGRMFGKNRASRTRDVSFSAAGATVLAIANTWGDVEVRASDSSDVHIEASISAWGADEASAAEVADGVEIRHVREGEKLVVEHGFAHAPGRARYKVDLEVTVPRSMRVEVRGMSGNLAVAGMAGGARLSTLSGDISASGVSGGVEADSKSGDVELRGCSGDVKASTVSGELSVLGHRGRVIEGRSVSGEVAVEATLDDGAQLSLKSVSGDVRLKLPVSSAVGIEAETVSGEVDCDLPLVYSERGTRRVRGVLGSNDGRVTLSTKSGSIAIRRLA